MENHKNPDLEKNNIMEINYEIEIDLNKNIESFHNFMKNLSEINNLIGVDLVKNINSFSYSFKNANKLIANYFKEKYIVNKQKKKIVLTKINIEKYYYFKTFIDNYDYNKNKKYSKRILTKNRIICQFIVASLYIIFNFTIDKKNKNNNDKSNFIIVELNKLLNIIFIYIEKLYIDNIINDDYLELVLFLLLSFSFSQSIDKIPKEKEITNMIFFSCCIKLMKKIFNKILLLSDEFTIRQEQIINNIISYINNNLIGSFEGLNKANYLNKVFLCKNDYKTSYLLDLSFIISKIKLQEVKNNFINLLTNIYIFSFEYKNLMSSIVKQTEPLFINIHKKNINKLQDELNYHDFSLTLLDSLINKEMEYYRNRICILDQGFFLGSKNSGLIYDFNNLDNEIYLLVGFKLFSTESENMTLLQFYCKQTKTVELNIFFQRNFNMNSFEMFIADKKLYEWSTKINILSNKTYVFLFYIKNGGLLQQSTIRIKYIKEENIIGNNKDFVPNIFSGKDITLKNFRMDNSKIYVGCKYFFKKENKVINNFKGFIGDLFIFNKNFKSISNDNNNEYEKNLHYLSNYSSNIFNSLQNQKDQIYSNDYSKFKDFYNCYLKEKMNVINKNNNLLDSLKTLVSPRYFKVIEYHDNIDYLNYTDNYEFYEEKRNNQFEIKKKYLDLKNKGNNEDNSDNQKIIIGTSLFDKYFHIFEKKFTLIEFINNDGFNYLYLLVEYYYQIINQLCVIKNKSEIIDINNICKSINLKINNLLNFFERLIFGNKLYINSIKETSRFLCQMLVALQKFLEIYILDSETIGYIVKLLNLFNYNINKDLKNNNIYNKSYISIRNNLYDFLLNPKLYPNKDINSLEKLNYVMENLLNIIKIKNNIICEGVNSLINIDILNNLLSFLWLLDNSKYISNEIDNKNNNFKNNLFKLITSNYSIILIEFLKYTNEYNLKNKKSLSETSLVRVKGKQEGNHNYSQNLKFEMNNKTSLVQYFFDKILEKKYNSSIFSRMILILLKTNLINILEEQRIEKLKYLFTTISKEKEEKFTDSRKLLLLSCLQVLIVYYYSENETDSFVNIDNNNTNNSNNKIKEFRSFIKKMDLSLDLFYSLISSFKTIKYFSNASSSKLKDNIGSAFEIIEKEDYMNIKTNNNGEINITDIIKDIEEMNLISVPFQEILFEKLNKSQIEIIKNLFEDLVYLLNKYDDQNLFKKSEIKNIKYNESSESTLSLDHREAEKEMIDILKKNLDIIFEVKNNELINEIFSYNTNIGAELFYLKWKLNNKVEIEAKNIENLILKYHRDLLKSHSSPFIYKFFLMISKNCISLETINEKYIINQTKISLLNSIIDVLNNSLGEPQKLKKNMIAHIYNLINVAIILNNELNNNSKNFFTDIKFIDIFYKYIKLLNQTGLLYSNYYIELEEKQGKVISEIIFDLFFELSKYYSNESEFFAYFTKENKDKKEIYSIFYLMDLLKGETQGNDKNAKQDIEKSIPDVIVTNLKIIHFYFFKGNKSLKENHLIQNRKLYSIEGYNFSMYFLVKSFIYLESKEYSKELVKLMEEKFLPCLLNNIDILYNKRKNLYCDNICKNFQLYSKTKTFFEENQQQNKYTKMKKYFKEDLSNVLEEFKDIKLCCSSRLIHNLFPKAEKSSLTSILSLKQFNLRRATTVFESKIPEKFRTFNPHSLVNMNIYNPNQSFILLDEMNITKFSDDFSFDKEETIFSGLYEKIKKKGIIYKPKNYFFKKIFSNIFKDIIFHDKTFKSIRLAYLIKYRKFPISMGAKQINYPTTQKNFSNLIEPRIFLRRDYNFYDKTFFPISHKYINSNIIEKNEEKIYFYPHEYKLKDTMILNENTINCELVTNQFIYFGKIYFTYDYILFETEKEDPRNSNLEDIDLETFFKYSISTRSKEKTTEKHKSILIFCEDIKEVIQKRTLLVNQSLEIFIKNGKSYFFNFFRTSEILKAYNFLGLIKSNLLRNHLKKFSFNINNNKEDIKSLLELFNKGKINNYDYLLFLNKYSTRTYNDLTQYPIFPWIIFDYTKYDDIFNELLNNNEISYLRDMNYPVAAQTEEKRKEIIGKYLMEKNKFSSHYGNNYSNSAYIFYYLMRINPYSKNIIRLQNYKLESPDRTFDSIEDIGEALLEGFENREMIPDMFCYIDYNINVNCSYFGVKSNKSLVDDFNMRDINTTQYSNNISYFVKKLYNEKKLLNHSIISENLSSWVDNIFGKNQLPKKEEDLVKCCNIFKKFSYEQKLNLENKIDKYQQLYNLDKSNNNKMNLINKFNNKADLLKFLGMVPKQILSESNLFGGESKINEITYKRYKSSEEKNIYFTKIDEDNLLILKKDNKTKTKLAIICENKNIKSKENQIYECKYINSLKNRNYFKYYEKKISLYRINYAVSFLQIEINKNIITFILSCRYLGNYFIVQNNESTFNVFCEDFVTCIKGNNHCSKEKNYFYIGLLNGKLIEWKIKSINNLQSNCNKSKKSKNFKIKRKKNIYAHNSSITAIEIYYRQNILITAGEDKFIHIRKLFDFELLTSIDLTYSFGNPIVSKTINIFPSSIKISGLNLLYVIIYDYDSKMNFIRGYNLNGLFFAQTDPKKFTKKTHNSRLLFNNISFAKNGNIIVWCYNWKKIMVLNAWNLMPIWNKNLERDKKEKEEIKNNRDNIIKWLEYNNNSKEFYMLYDNKFVVEILKEKEEQKLFDSF